MTTEDRSKPFEYPDAAGYPDGAGFLDEGTAALIQEVASRAAHDLVKPSVDAESEITVRRAESEGAYVASIDRREIAALRFDEVDGRAVILTTTVDPAFRGRGIAANLIANALDDIRQRGMRVTVYCRVVAAFMTGNEQYTDLIDPENPGLKAADI